MRRVATRTRNGAGQPPATDSISILHILTFEFRSSKNFRSSSTIVCISADVKSPHHSLAENTCFRVQLLEVVQRIGRLLEGVVSRVATIEHKIFRLGERHCVYTDDKSNERALLCNSVQVRRTIVQANTLPVDLKYELAIKVVLPITKSTARTWQTPLGRKKRTRSEVFSPTYSLQNLSCRKPFTRAQSTWLEFSKKLFSGIELSVWKLSVLDTFSTPESIIFRLRNSQSPSETYSELNQLFPPDSRLIIGFII